MLREYPPTRQIKGGKASPILVPDGIFDPGRILEIFEAESVELPDDYRGFIRAKIRELGD